MRKALPNLFHSFLVMLLCTAASAAREHPSVFITTGEAAAIRENLTGYPLLEASFNQMRDDVAAAMQGGIEIPPPGEAGGYEHERHKQNYRDMQQAGLLFVITGETPYAAFARDILLGYAAIYPELGAHPLSHNQAPGKIFHQTLNEQVWLVYASIAYDCIYNWLSPEDRSTLETRLFIPMVDWISVRNARVLDSIHNHGTWACAAVGMIGYVMDRQDWVDRALYGTKRDGSGGFLRQLDLLFSPDGYYMEGPYYIRYALRPFFLLADAVERSQPEVKIYTYREQILKKVLYATLQTVFPNGIFPPINDASRTMDVRAAGPVFAHNLAYRRYGGDDNLLAIAAIQNEVLLNGAGLQVARDLAEAAQPAVLNWPSLELRDGFDGEQGGLGILRRDNGPEQTMLLMKYGVHGLGHGHFDKLHILFFDQGREVLPDYGFSRWINIEPKFGGRYLPENNSYAKQTIAHNTVVVDQQTQNRGNHREADLVAGERHFFDSVDPDLQVMSARANRHYPGVQMQRTVFLVRNEAFDHPFIIDLYRLQSAQKHTYDYPLHFRGQMITSNTALQAETAMLQPLGNANGYQHLWKTASVATDSMAQFTWLDGNRYYTVSAAASPKTTLICARSGANDPNFNLYSEPMLLLRREAQDHLFATIIEPHGYFNEAAEMSRNARSRVKSIRVVGHSNTASVAEISTLDGHHWRLMVNNGPATAGDMAVVLDGRTYRWKGNYALEKLDKQTNMQDKTKH